MYFVCSGPSGTACTIPNLTMISWVLRTDRDVQCNGVMSGKLHVDKCSTVPVDRMSHRKWREAKQQPSRTRSGNHINCCLVSLHFQRDIQSTAPVQCLTRKNVENLLLGREAEVMSFPLIKKNKHLLCAYRTVEIGPDLGFYSRRLRNLASIKIKPRERPTRQSKPANPNQSGAAAAIPAIYLCFRPIKSGSGRVDGGGAAPICTGRQSRHPCIGNSVSVARATPRDDIYPPRSQANNLL